MKRLNILEHFETAEEKPNIKGRPMAALHIRQIVWDFWHSNSFQSTLTSRPAKLKIGKKPKIQASLDYLDSVRLVTNKRKIAFFESLWLICEKTYCGLFHEFLLENDGLQVGLTTFLALRPFYVRSATPRDIEMCCCKDHLIARWSIRALVNLAGKSGVELPFKS